jgi:predicted anti-sigma-YlaC factor YlaD
MNETIVNFEACPLVDIGAYVDGELDNAAMEKAEAHFARCRPCRDELNLQKRFLATISGGLRQQIAIPADFAKTVVANAEGRVEGLRAGRERLNAAFIVSALLLFVMFALGAEFWLGLSMIARAGEQLAAVAGIIASTAYSFFVGALVVVRALAAGAEASVFMMLGVSLLALAAASGWLHRLSRP